MSLIGACFSLVSLLQNSTNSFGSTSPETAAKSMCMPFTTSNLFYYYFRFSPEWIQSQCDGVCNSQTKMFLKQSQKKRWFIVITSVLATCFSAKLLTECCFVFRFQSISIFNQTNVGHFTTFRNQSTLGFIQDKTTLILPFLAICLLKNVS